MTQRITMSAALVFIVTAGSVQVFRADAKSAEASAHGAYVAAIISNDTAKLRAQLTDDIAYQAPMNPRSSEKTPFVSG